jgi:hypothetical protein
MVYFEKLKLTGPHFIIIILTYTIIVTRKIRKKKKNKI